MNNICGKKTVERRKPGSGAPVMDVEVLCILEKPCPVYGGHMETKTIKVGDKVLTIEYDNYEGRIMDGNFILAKIYACEDGLMISTE